MDPLLHIFFVSFEGMNTVDAIPSQMCKRISNLMNKVMSVDRSVLETNWSNRILIRETKTEIEF